MADTEPAIRVRGLRKAYGEIQAVRELDLEVARGEVFALLGPNGAGKTTTVEILEGYRARDAGEVSVLGMDPAHHAGRLKERIGIVLQSTGLRATSRWRRRSRCTPATTRGRATSTR